MIIDVHHHYYPEPYLKYLGRTDVPPRRASPLSVQTMAERLELLDEAGIDTAVLSISQAQPYLDRVGQAADGARLINDLYLEAAERHSGRFAAFIALPLPHVDAALSELERVMDEPKAVGVSVGCTVNGRPLDDSALGPIWQELNRRHGVVFLHPMGREDLSWLQGYNLTWMVGAPFEDTVAALRLVASGMVVRYPEIRFIVPHLGGTLPFLFARLIRQAENPSLGDGLARLYYDTVSGSTDALQMAAGVFGAEQLLFGTDYPYCDRQAFFHHLQYLREGTFSGDQLRNIEGARAAALLGML